MAFFGDFDAPWLAGRNYSRFSNPYSHAYEDVYHPRQRQHGYSGEPFGQVWPDLLFSPQHAAPRQRERHYAHPERVTYMRDEADLEALQRRNWLLAQLEQDRQEQAARRSGSFASDSHRGHRPGTAYQMHRSQSPEHWSAAELFGMPPSRPPSRPVPSHTRAASPAVYSIHSFHGSDYDKDSHDGNDAEQEDQDMQPAPLELERDRLQQLKKRQQLHDLQLRQQHLREQQQQALQEQRRREALIERELRSQREAQRRRAEEHRLEQQQQEALLAALQQQRRQQEQRLRQQEKRRAQQQQAEQQAELAHRMQQLWQSHLEQEQRKAGQASSAEPDGPQAGKLDNALDQLFKRQQAQQAQRAQQDKQPAQQQPAQQQAKQPAEQLVQQQQSALHAQQQEAGKLAQHAFEQPAQHAFEQPAQHPHQPRFDPLAQHSQHAQHAYAQPPYQQTFKQPAQQAQQAKHAQPAHQQTFKQHTQQAAMPGPGLKAKQAKRDRMTPDEAARDIQRHYQGYRIRSEKPLLKQLAKANHQLAQIFARLYQVEGCTTALLAAAQGKLKGGAAVRLKHHHGKCGSPEQLQKQLLELSELSMQVVLSMDELHSERAEVRAVRKQVVKKALALMERIDNIKAGMLRSLLDITHPHDQLESRPSQLESRASQLESRASQLESRASQLDTRSSQLGTPQGQLESQPSQVNNPSPAASPAQAHSFADPVSSGEQRTSKAMQGLHAANDQDQAADNPSNVDTPEAENSSPPAGLAGAALPGKQGPTDAQPGIGTNSPGTQGIPNGQQANASSQSKQRDSVAQQAVDAPSSQQSHQAVLDTEKADIYSVASAFAGAATPAQTDSEHEELRDREDKVDGEVTRQILTALQQQGRHLIPGAFENTEAHSTDHNPEEDIHGTVEDADEDNSEQAAA